MYEDTSLEKRIWKWLDSRSAVSSTHRLSHRNLYILPTKRGGYFILITFVLWLMGTNYQNNLVLALVFLMISIFVVSILHTFDNMVSLSIDYNGVDDVFAGSEANFSFILHSKKKRWSDAIDISWQYDCLSPVSISVPPKGDNVFCEVPKHTVKRGWIDAGRMCIESRYPLGLFRCWTWLKWDEKSLVFPEPLIAERLPTLVDDDLGDGTHPVKGGEDYTDLRSYRDGDTPKHIAWKVYAREQGLLVKEFTQNVSQERWLDFDMIDAADLEEKLSALCYWALHFHKEDENYGLRMPGHQFSPDKGDGHKHRVLVALATFSILESKKDNKYSSSGETPKASPFEARS